MPDMSDVEVYRGAVLAFGSRGDQTSKKLNYMTGKKIWEEILASLINDEASGGVYPRHEPPDLQNAEGSR
jgi:hypothetical protein